MKFKGDEWTFCLEKSQFSLSLSVLTDSVDKQNRNLFHLETKRKGRRCSQGAPKITFPQNSGTGAITRISETVFWVFCQRNRASFRYVCGSWNPICSIQIYFEQGESKGNVGSESFLVPP